MDRSRCGRLGVQRARVDDRLGRFLTAQHDQQIAHHSRLALLVEFDDIALLELVEGHVDHANRAGNQLLACLALLVITNYLARKGGYGFLTTGIPCIVMAVITAWAVTANECAFVSNATDPAKAAKAAQYWLLAAINGIVLVLAVWVMVEGILALVRNVGSQERD